MVRRQAVRPWPMTSISATSTRPSGRAAGHGRRSGRTRRRRPSAAGHRCRCSCRDSRSGRRSANGSSIQYRRQSETASRYVVSALTVKPSFASTRISASGYNSRASRVTSMSRCESGRCVHPPVAAADLQLEVAEPELVVLRRFARIASIPPCRDRRSRCRRCNTAPAATRRRRASRTPGRRGSAPPDHAADSRGTPPPARSPPAPGRSARPDSGRSAARDPRRTAEVPSRSRRDPSPRRTPSELPPRP